MEATNDGFHFFAYQVIAQITDGAFMGMMLDPVVMLSGRRRVSTDKSHQNTTCPAEGGFPRTNCTAEGNKNQEKRLRIA